MRTFFLFFIKKIEQNKMSSDHKFSWFLSKPQDSFSEIAVFFPSKASAVLSLRQPVPSLLYENSIAMRGLRQGWNEQWQSTDMAKNPQEARALLPSSPNI